MRAVGLIGGTKAAAAASRLLSLSVPRPLWGLKEDLECVRWCGVACPLAQAQIKAPPQKKTNFFTASRSRGLTMICGDEISTKFLWGGGVRSLCRGRGSGPGEEWEDGGI